VGEKEALGEFSSKKAGANTGKELGKVKSRKSM